ncbi:MAG: hypothetical protein DRP49_06165 [Spirochaetes bacterium]|nr:MAG: hypothetical protein DRP49_06165 [Spirochaetota bacterium]
MMENPEKLPFGLRRRLMTVFLSIILTLSVLNAFNLVWVRVYFKEFSLRQMQQANLQELISLLRDTKSNFYNYSRSSNNAYLEGNDLQQRRINRLIDEEKVKAAPESDIYYSLKDISRMITTLFETEEVLLADVKRGISTIYIQDKGDELVRLSDYIIEELQLAVEFYMKELSSYYREFSRRMTVMNYLSFSLLLIAMFFAIYSSGKFVLSVSRPIHQLAIQLVHFGEGDLETRVGSIKGKDEIAVLGRSFNRMADRIRGLITDIQDNAGIEQRLIEQKLARQEAERLLKEAELAHLQAQINPHFLFNTLNILGSLSVVEEAPQTGRIISDLSELLRYSLKTGSGLVQLKEEIDVIRSYMNIQGVRFGNKISYEEIIGEELPEMQIPGMILQPLAENAVKHGLEPIERPGKITLEISVMDEHLEIQLSDNGVGISDKALSLLNDTAVYTDSLGIRNVQRRLMLHYGKKVLDITRRTEGGTNCRIILPVSPVIPR